MADRGRMRVVLAGAGVAAVLAVSGWLGGGGLRAAEPRDAGAPAVRVADAVRAVVEGFSAEEPERAFRRLEELATEHPDSTAPVTALVRLAERAGEFAVAERALDRLIEREPENAALRQERGVIRFFRAEIGGSLEDFDAYLEARPTQRPYHWQRGLALYYAGRFEEGVRQFEDHRTVNPNDVENAVWHFLCKARAESLEAAREALIPFTRDTRVPMKEIHDLFAGHGSREAVLAAAGAGADSPAADDAETRNRLCFAHLYLALHEEITGDAEASLRDARLAAVDYAMPHYMGRVAQVHLRLRRPPASPAEPDDEDGDGGGDALPASPEGDDP